MAKNKANEYGCFYCGHKPKKIPYGSKRGFHWCGNCDRDMVTSVNKKRERQKSKKEIEKGVDDYESKSMPTPKM